MNQVTLVGRLTKDPELRITPEGTPVVNLTLAVNRQFKNQNGDYETDFVHCTIWRKTAENTANYCRKGSVLGVTGKIHTRNYQNQDGKKVYVTEVVAENVQFLSRRPANDEQQSSVNPRPSAQTQPPTDRRDWEPSNTNMNSSSQSMNIPPKEKEDANAAVTARGIF
ncbi:single-stranded DNA-binding protein [Pseudoneobacillus rhizosphaerae]|uniref:single-stranded DNA-binding protein n=1 Tax=Pseudoneobacillus rhizosphaerae TaxID=2880968 RepID=UPI0025B6D465|nr:single-stranded DNA-binding protein [Pseudoneobacillus rhizosphaerae]